MDAVQVQYQPYTQDPTRQSWRNNSSNNEQRRDSNNATQLQNLGRVPQTATFPTKTNRNYSLPNPPKTATFPKHSNGFPKDIRQSTSRFPTTPSSNSSSSQHAYALTKFFLLN
ncbi:14287_t:CDS:2 [Entrophospora sp. SA101]|nr:14287_t:CDS:2 [Entrophospora sp. SA101]CAJ0824047.1 5996_t:CDS:2 [Entrophospora sp. SA101]